MIYKAKVSKINIAPKKVRSVVNAVKGLPLPKALALLSQWSKKASYLVRGAILQAVNNAKNKGQKKEEEIKIKEIRVNAGPTLKRTLARSRGQADLIKRRSSQIEVFVEAGQ